MTVLGDSLSQIWVWPGGLGLKTVMTVFGPPPPEAHFKGIAGEAHLPSNVQNSAGSDPRHNAKSLRQEFLLR